MEQKAFTDTPASCCVYYRRVCGLPAVVDHDTGRILLRAGVVGAITMPGELGARVRDELAHRRMCPGPTISHVGSGRWSYLCRPDTAAESADMRLFGALFRLNVSIASVGATIALPSPTRASMRYRRWIVAPRNTFRPSLAVTLDAIAACTGGWS
ncbi:hypothetical protein NONO_c16900 [Nocardia nova SH22a]|uniref:DNA-directed RNA polymerase subunit beta n=1 Tax=Nocardia nova SH22a TaxID=1415166 RepID=W5TGX2_9NOCA|nr:hypothetical protein [Nocardia nova]AHH16491.1 hypothetical protein NONO_c16900 [Nocardia nova SH22a]